MSIHATVTGGYSNRMVDAEFAVDQDAYVLVAAVARDGHVHVLFPENARMTGFVTAHTSYDVPTFAEAADAMSAFYSRPITTSVGARMDSYDGQGSSFVFAISSSEPLNFAGIAEDDGTWDSFLLPGYGYGNDPRRAIEEFASVVGSGGDYRVTYASSFASTRYTSFADRLFDCAASEFALGYLDLPWMWNYFGNEIGRWDVYDDYAGMSCRHRYPRPTVYAFYSLPLSPPFTPQPPEYATLKVFHHPLVTDQVDSRRTAANLAAFERPLVASRVSDNTSSAPSAGTTIYYAHHTPGAGNTGGIGGSSGTMLTTPATPTILTRTAPATHTTTTLTPVDRTITRSAPETRYAPPPPAHYSPPPPPNVPRAAPAPATSEKPHQH